MKNFGILLLAMVSCCLLQAKNRVVKQPPFIARSSSTIEIDRVVVSDTATVLDIKAFFRPHNWIQISNESYLLADNGEKYPIRSGNGITLGEKFWMPDSGEASFSLIFPLLPPTVKVIDFIESDCEDCFKVWGIHLDGKLPELDLSDDVKKQKLNYAEPLPKAELKDGKSVITGRLLDYEKHYALPFSCRICDLLTAKFEDTEIKVNEDGTFRTEIELCAPTTVSFSVGRDIYFDVFLVPGGELDMAVNLRELSRSESKLLKGKRAGGKKVYFSGTMAALNDEMITDDEHLMDVWGMVHWNMNDLYNMTAGQYKAYWLKKYEETKSAICSDKKRSQAYRNLLLAHHRAGRHVRPGSGKDAPERAGALRRQAAVHLRPLPAVVRVFERRRLDGHARRGPEQHVLRHDRRHRPQPEVRYAHRHHPDQPLLPRGHRPEPEPDHDGLRRHVRRADGGHAAHLPLDAAKPQALLLHLQDVGRGHEGRPRDDAVRVRLLVRVPPVRPGRDQPHAQAL